MSPIKFIEDETQFSGKYAPTVYNTLYQAYRKYLKASFFLMILGLMGRILLLANANIVGIWVDSLCSAPNPCKEIPSIFKNWESKEFVMFMVFLSLSGLGLTLIFRIAFSRIGARAVSQIYDEVTLRTSRLPMSFFDSTPTGRIVTRFSSDYGNMFRLFGGPLAEFVGIIFDLIAMVVLISVANPLYLFIVVFIAILNYSVYRFNQKSLRKERRALALNRSPSISHFSETTQGSSIIKSFQKQANFFDRFSYLNNLFLKQRLSTTKALLLFSLQMNFNTSFLLFLTGVSAYYLIHLKLVSIGSIGVAFSFISIAGNTLQMFFDWIAQFEEAMIGVERLDQYLRQNLEPGLRLPVNTEFITKHPIYSDEEYQKLKNYKVQAKSAEIEVKNLSFRYREHLPDVLKNLNFKINAGEKIGIIGKTGSGKTSLIQVLYHLYPYQQGEILINKQKANLQSKAHQELMTHESKTQTPIIELEWFRRHMSLITQDPIIFKSSLRDNLSFQTEINDKTRIEALNRVGLNTWFEQLEFGLDTQIEERGKNLSQGEKQLICMARCLLQETPIVIMDEATSNVDPQSEEIMVRATNEFFAGRTQIIIAHRLSTIQKCDRILWLDQGEIKMFGETADILAAWKQA